MSKPVILSTQRWLDLRARLMEDYPISYTALSWKCKEKLGFKIRTYDSFKKDYQGITRFVTDIRLDFYNEPKRTMFLLKYGEYVSADTFDRMD